jgi:hypothetical protein
MTVRKETKEEIAQEVKNQLALAIESLKPKGIKKVLYWAREWGLSSVLVMGPLALVTITVGALYYSFSAVRENSEFRAHTSDRLDRIEGQLRLLLAPQAPSAVLKEIGELGQKAFSMSLPALRKVSEQPVSAVKPEPATLREVTSRLRFADESSPDYWPAVLQFIQFASSAMTPPKDVPPPEIGYTEVSENHCYNMPPGGHCVTASHQAILLDGGDIPNSVFDHCRIKFTEKPVGLSGTTFIDCVFEMPISGSPSPYLRDAAKTLLAGNLINVSFPKS